MTVPPAGADPSPGAGEMNPLDEAQLQAYANLFYYRQAIGPRAEYYLRQFEKFERAGDRWEFFLLEAICLESSGP